MRAESGGEPIELGILSEALLSEAVASGRADCIYAFCRLNAEAVKAVAAARIATDALPLSADAVAAEVLAEVADSIRFVSANRVQELYRSIPSLIREVIANAVDEVLGFVPTLQESIGAPQLAEAVAAKLELPADLLSGVSDFFDPPTTRVLAAQALLQLSVIDRTHLLESRDDSSAHEPGAASVADLLSIDAARRRFTEEFDRIARWLRRALSPACGSSDETSGELA